jgi:Ca2+/Na+ antiporter
VGNVVGSNITNVLLVLGLAALVLPVAVRGQLVRVDVPVMVVMSVLLLVLALDGAVSTVDGILLLVLLVGLRRALGAGEPSGHRARGRRPGRPRRAAGAPPSRSWTSS